MAVIPTVRIQDGDDYALINKSDFDPAIHQLYVKRKPKKKPVVDDDVDKGNGNGDGSDDGNSNPDL